MTIKAKIYVYSLILPLLFAFGSYANTPKGPRPPIDYASLSPDVYKSGVIRIKFSAEASAQLALQPMVAQKSGDFTTGIHDFDLLASEFGITEGSKIVPVADQTAKSQSLPAFAGRHAEWGFDRWYEFSLSTKSEIGGVVEAFSKLESVDIAEPVFNVYPVHTGDFETAGATATSKSGGEEPHNNDPSFKDQWSLQNLGQAGGVPGSDIDMVKAWEMQKGKSEVIVAIIDGGIRYDHPDLAANMWVDSEGNHGFNFADGNNTIVPNNHATHVAGIISAVSNNGEGIAGIAGGSGHGDGVKLMAAQVFSENRSGGFHLAPVYAADNGAALTQNSWVYGAEGVYDHLALDAIDYFNTYGGGNVMEGGITIFAAGNQGKDGLFYPACYEGVIAVASTNQSDQKAASSNYGSWIDISAPGVGIMSTLANNKYGISSGTSMASPHVSGVAALIISEAAGQLTSQQLKDILLTTAENLDAENPAFPGMMGYGRINALNALNAVRALIAGGTNPETENEEPDTDNETPAQTAFYFLKDGEWNDPDNWFSDADGEFAASRIPSPADEIHVFAAANDNGEIRLEGNGSISIHRGGKITAARLTRASGNSGQANLFIKPGACLTVTDRISGTDNDNFILVQSDATGSGSLIHNGNDVLASFEYHTPGNGITWEMLALPVTGTDMYNSIPSLTVYNWFEPELKWIELNPGKKTNEGNPGDATENSLTPGKGYLVNYNAAILSQQEIVFSGNLHTGDFSFPLSHRANTSDAFSGYNLLGNPYASSIDWNNDDGWTGREHLDAVDGQGYTLWIWNRETGNYGSYNSSSHSFSGTNGSSRYIAPMQAFWVKADANNRAMTVNNQARTHANASENILSGTAPNAIKLTLTSDLNSYSDELILEFGHSSAKGGAEKLFSMLEEAPGIYTSSENVVYSIRFLDSAINNPLIPVGFTAGGNGTYEISAQISQQFSEAAVLIDLHNGNRHDLSKSGAYRFYTNAGDDAERFILQLGNEQTTGINQADAEVPGIFFNNGQLNILNPWDIKADVAVYDLSGATIASFDSAPHSHAQSTLDASPGVYVVRLISEGKQYTSRVLTW